MEENISERKCFSTNPNGYPKKGRLMSYHLMLEHHEGFMRVARRNRGNRVKFPSRTREELLYITEMSLYKDTARVILTEHL
uniref:Uncharacterized protein n=1 Tax=Megaselia scalaris TaxID=36166 RepID=T1GS48_MEGSC